MFKQKMSHKPEVAMFKEKMSQAPEVAMFKEKMSQTPEVAMFKEKMKKNEVAMFKEGVSTNVSYYLCFPHAKLYALSDGHFKVTPPSKDLIHIGLVVQ